VLGLAAGCGLVITGLWQLGVIEIAEPEGLPSWLSKESAAPKPSESAEATAKPSPEATKNAQPAAPSASPVPVASAAGEQLLVQAASAAAVSENAKAWLDELSKVVLKPNEMFSLDDWVKKTAAQTKLEMKRDEISQIAGLLYEAALRGGLTIGERHIHQELPSYATKGFDVAYQENGKNLTLLNPHEFTVLAGVVISGNYPIVYLKGKADAKWAPLNLEVVDESLNTEKVELVDFALGTGGGETKRQEGKKGLLVQVRTKGSEVVRVLAKDYYAPVPTIVARGPTAEEATLKAQ
jgi:hypothetical protein